MSPKNQTLPNKESIVGSIRLFVGSRLYGYGRGLGGGVLGRVAGVFSEGSGGLDAGIRGSGAGVFDGD